MAAAAAAAFPLRFLPEIENPYVGTLDTARRRNGREIHEFRVFDLYLRNWGAAMPRSRELDSFSGASGLSFDMPLR